MSYATFRNDISTREQAEVWMQDGACRHSKDLFMEFAGNSGTGDAHDELLARCRFICGICPVYDTCYSYALDSGAVPTSDTAVWAGTDQKERRAIKRRRRDAQRKLNLV